MVLDHGGRLNEAAKRWGIPRSEWLDLSTGINPVGWPVPDIPAEVWQRLPEADDGLEEVIREWSGASPSAACVPVPGSQAAIMALPGLRNPCRVGIPEPGYREHGYNWRNAGHTTIPIGPEQTRCGLSGCDDRWLDQVDVLVWINPNNPTGKIIPPSTLLRWHQRLQKRGGWLVVDEAFMDATPAFSLCTQAGRPGLIVLRSLGKFFGLAGVRAGFVLADDWIAGNLRQALGPWALSGPARYVMRQALRDRGWQNKARVSLQQNMGRLREVLQEARLTLVGGTVLFQTVRADNPVILADQLAAQAVLVRVLDQPGMLRFGALANEKQLRQLMGALAVST
ncbi:threonine-phosphate decarboxylase CobD [Marinobacter sp. 2_MG-2023]|uniref:threonine-phosphate decarboxylase CobD n=1 Tax=Marinobacter sp. 2_MG-2023 TaxID=3062679 RepID=UPI0026E33B4D|nr:threonine-phosphate decarboxylase CobD [Marinobacter sp. 2_MG-2023]MDO6443264.1 threonine-phosphate decarboxylase CobD [Marinobacter sp. 2_MG-2023]